MRIAHNSSALNAYISLKQRGHEVTKSSARLSVGYRVNSGADDAAGLTISIKMRSQIRGLDQAGRNAQDAISLIETAECGLSNIDEIIQRMRELVVLASNDTNNHNMSSLSESDRAKIQYEIDQLVDEIDRTAANTQFNAMTLLNGRFAQPSAVGASGAAVLPFSSAIAPTAGITAAAAQLSPPAGAAAYTKNDLTKTITITGDGVLDLSSLGDITDYDLNVNATNVQLTQSGGQINNLMITCSAGTNLFIEDLNILYTKMNGESINRSSITFQGAGNTLNLMGTNYFERTDMDTVYPYPIIQVETNTALTINNAAGHNGDLKAVMNARTVSGGSVIGSRYWLNCGEINIYGGNITVEVNAGSNGGYAIGGSRCNLTITGGQIKTTVNCIYIAGTSGANTGAAIGGGGGTGGKTTITGGDITAIINAKQNDGWAIGGYDPCNLTITGGRVKTEINVTTNNGSAFGSYNTGSITISGGEVWTDINATTNNGAAVGGRTASNLSSSSDGTNLTLNGGKLHMNGGHIGAGSSTTNPGSPGTVKFSDKNEINLYFNDLDRTIYNGVSTIRDMYDTPLYRTEIMIDGIDFTPNSDVTYTIGGGTYTSKVDVSGRLYLYLPLSNNNGVLKTSVDGTDYAGTLTMLNNHNNVLMLAEPDDEDPPHPPGPPDPPDPPEPPDIPNPPDPPDGPNPPVPPKPPASPGGSLWIQTGANAIQGVYLNIEAMNSVALGLRDNGGNNVVNVQRKSGADITSLLNTIDSALTKTSNERARLGAMQSRLEFTINSLSISSESISEAESRIRDADMAKEMMSLSKNNALSQASMLMLTQANQQPDMVLTLLKA